MTLVWWRAQAERNAQRKFPIVRARDQFKQELALQGIHTPLGSAFNPAVYLYCLLRTENKESFSLSFEKSVEYIFWY